MTTNYIVHAVDFDPWTQNVGVHEWDPVSRVLEITYLLKCSYHDATKTSRIGRIKAQMWIPAVDITIDEVRIDGVFVSSSPTPEPIEHLYSIRRIDNVWVQHNKKNLLGHSDEYYYNEFYMFCQGHNENRVLDALYNVTQVSTNLFEITNKMKRRPNTYIPLIMFDSQKVPHIVAVRLEDSCAVTGDTFLNESTSAFEELERYRLALRLMD